MKKYDVVITETLQRIVQIEANDRDEAEQIAKKSGEKVSMFWMKMILKVWNIVHMSMQGIVKKNDKTPVFGRS